MTNYYLLGVVIYLSLAAMLQTVPNWKSFVVYRFIPAILAIIGMILLEGPLRMIGGFGY